MKQRNFTKTIYLSVFLTGIVIAMLATGLRGSQAQSSGGNPTTATSMTFSTAENISCAMTTY